MPKPLQFLLLAVGVIALIVVVVDLFISIAATTHSNTPARVVHVTAGPYPLTVSLYKDPANAGYALPFAVTIQQPLNGSLNYNVTSIPAQGMHATPVRAGLTPDGHNGIQGTAELPVQGSWTLHIIVDGSSGRGEADVPITAAAPPAIPNWLGWLIGLIPLYGLLAFLLTQRGHKKVDKDNNVTSPEGNLNRVGA